jgi:predicted nuclease of predicted toxin-antitoxin system
MRFLVDAQLPPALARILSAKGFEAEHVYDVQLGTAQDSAIWDYALRRRLQ